MNEQTCPWAIKDADGKTIGIGIPVINKALYFEDVPKNDKPMNWHDAMKHAKLLGRALRRRGWPPGLPPWMGLEQHGVRHDVRLDRRLRFWLRELQQQVWHHQRRAARGSIIVSLYPFPLKPRTVSRAGAHLRRL